MELIHPWGSVTCCQENTATEGKVWRDRWLVLDVPLYFEPCKTAPSFKDRSPYNMTYSLY